MFPTQKEMEITIDFLIKKIWELNMTLAALENKSKALDEALENFNKEKDKIESLKKEFLILKWKMAS